MDWDDERIRQLTELWGEGQSANQIARQIAGATRNAVIGKAHRLGLARRENPIRQPGVGTHADHNVKRDVARQTIREQKPAPAAKILPEPTPLWIVAPEKVISPEPTTLITLEETQARKGCLWPHGNRPFLFCGKDRASIDAPYCPAHQKLAKGYHLREIVA